MLTLDLSTKVAHIGVRSTYQNIVFSETTKPIELKFHMKTTYDRFAKTDTNCSGHMTKMATTPAKFFKYLLLWNQKALGLGM